MKIFLLPIVLFSITTADVEQAVLDHLNAHYPVQDAEYVCDFSRINLSRIPESDSVAVDGYGKENPKGQVVVYFSYFKNGNRVYKTNGTVRVGVLKRVLISTVPVKSGMSFSSDNIKYETRDIARAFEEPFNSEEKLFRMVASKYIPPGRIITKSLAKMRPVVSKGERLRVLYRKGSLNLTVGGIAKQEGAKGDRIKVMNIDTRKIIYATIVDSTTVVISKREGI